MATQAEYDAALQAITVIAKADIAAAENQLPTFVKPRVAAGVAQHQAQIDATLRDIAKAAVDAAEKARTPHA